MSRLRSVVPLLLFSLFSLLVPFTLAAPSTTTIPRRSHSATRINQTVYFVGGLGSATDNVPLKSISALDLNQLVFTEISTSLAIYNHAASPSAWASVYAKETPKIGVIFGQSSTTNPGDALQWLDPETGNVTQGKNSGSGPGPSGGGVLVGRVGHSLVQLGNNLLAFGGRVMTRDIAKAGSVVAVSDTPILDLSSKTWYNITGGLSRYGHASARSGTERVVSCYGISTTGVVLENECVFFSIFTRLYTPVVLVWSNEDDRIIGERIGHSLVADESDTSKLYMFGGMNAAGTQFFQDLYLLDTTRLPIITITKLANEGATPTGVSLSPGARSDHAAVVVGQNSGFMIIHGGITANATNSTIRVMASSTPYYFSMASRAWIDGPGFVAQFEAQKVGTADNSVDVSIILVGILAGVSLLGAAVAYYIWRGLRDDELERLRKNAEEAGAEDPRMSSGTDDDPSSRKRGGRKERKRNSVYPLGSQNEDHSMAMEPFKSTSSLIQSDESGKKSNKKNNQGDGKPWTSGPYSPGATTLTDSTNGYMGSSSPSRLHKNNSIGSSSHRNNNNNNTNAQAKALAAPAAEGARNSYYKDLYLDDKEDDDSSITVSLASESTMSPWAGPRRLSLDLAPPNPRFSRGVMSSAHRQLVGAVSTQGHSSGWDTDSPGGSLYSPDDGDHNRRSVNSIQ